MSLLKEIQNAAINSDVSLTTLLRKCKVLAYELDNSDFKAWVENELSGYSTDKELPNYRVYTVFSKGNFVGAFGKQMRNADIPLACIPKEYHEYVSHSYLQQSVAAIESLINDSTEGTLSEPWNPDFVILVGTNIYEQMSCLQAWKVIPTSGLVAALDEIRNRILSFSLEIGQEFPDIIEATAFDLDSIPSEKVTHIFNTYVTGTVHNMATGSRDFKQKTINHNEVFSDLLNAISNAQADKQIINIFSAVIEEMRANKNADTFKDHYQKFIELLANHIGVFGPVIAPFLPALTSMMP